jgi:hypothetical protein
MEINQGLAELSQMFKGRDWFFDVGLDESSKLAVYVKYMNVDVLNSVPDRIGEHQVLIHFASSKTASREKFVEQPWKHVPFALTKKVVKVEELPSENLESDLEDLTSELDRLEKICGSNILQDVFYEVHDGKNAVTNLSAKYPEVHDSLLKLYEEYGFDVIYEELDG